MIAGFARICQHWRKDFKFSSEERYALQATGCELTTKGTAGLKHVTTKLAMLIKAYLDLSHILRLLEGASHWGTRKEGGGG